MKKKFIGMVAMTVLGVQVFTFAGGVVPLIPNTAVTVEAATKQYKYLDSFKLSAENVIEFSAFKAPGSGYYAVRFYDASNGNYISSPIKLPITSAGKFNYTIPSQYLYKDLGIVYSYFPTTSAKVESEGFGGSYDILLASYLKMDFGTFLNSAAYKQLRQNL